MSDRPIDPDMRLAPPYARGGMVVNTMGRIVFWGIVQFLLHLLEQVAELLAPLLFVAGLIWSAIGHVIPQIKLDDSLTQKALQYYPASLTLAGRVYTPHALIMDGLLLMALVAACRTAHAIIAKET